MAGLAGSADHGTSGGPAIKQVAAARIHINGIVQGVGFRPFVFNLAEDHGLKGWVRNSSAGVDIEVEGVDSEVKTFITGLQGKAPPLSRIDIFEVTDITPPGFQQFKIVHSDGNGGDFVPISPDVTVCEDCLAEMQDPADRRYHYPFINCTNCGPRFTIIKNTPYDRPFTTMADFPLCEACQQEYKDPRDRRFHAQPVACDNCGPRIWLEIEGEVQAEKEDALQQARKLLSAGKILAIRGLGGFHLACDATNSYVVAELRTRKLRVGKPFAVMFPTLEIIQNHCEVSNFEGEKIESRERPIVIVDRKPTSNIDPEVSPGQDTLGVMLPYTPLHALLLEPEDSFPQALVMTSGNLSDEPIATGNDEARERLSGLADAFLLHNRDIHIRCDDSVVRANPASLEHPLYPLRRSRGYAPNPIITKWDMPQILATGPMLKNTFCLTKDKYAFLSHHIGDLENFETLRSFEQGIEHFQGLFRVSPEVIAYDLHPDYLSTRYAIEKAQAEDLPAYGIQHHHAHIAACMADNEISPEARVIGLSYDGTGYGTDGTIWGGEVLLSSYQAFSRQYHLKPVPLPGGDAAVKEPWRAAVSWALAAGLDTGGLANLLIDIDQANIEQVTEQIANQINCPLTSSMGRLFDAVAALVGVRSRVNYEAQAAIELEALADPDEEGHYSFELINGQIDLTPMFQEIASERLAGIDVPTVSARFHNTITACSITACQAVQEDEGVKRVALSGGVWQNMVLLGKTTIALRQEGFEVLTHHQVPANDGGVAFGQAVIAYHTIINKE